MTESSTLREQAARYRRMLTTIDDQKTRDVLSKLAREFDDKADAAEAEEQRPIDGAAKPDT